MNLRGALYQFCEDNNLKDLSCIIHFAIVNYVSTHKSNNDEIYLSPKVLNSFIGIGEEKITSLFDYLSSNSKSIIKNYTLKCPDFKVINDQDEDDFCDVISEEEKADEDWEVSCTCCGKIHLISDIKGYETNYNGVKKEILKDLDITSQDIVKEMVVLNINKEHLDKLANIILSRLDIKNEKKEEAKTGIMKMLYTTKEVSGLISGIAGDVADTSDSVIKIAENCTGISTIKNLINK